MPNTFAKRICNKNMAEFKYCYILKVIVPLYNQHLTRPASTNTTSATECVYHRLARYPCFAKNFTKMQYISCIQ